MMMLAKFDTQDCDNGSQSLPLVHDSVAGCFKVTAAIFITTLTMIIIFGVCFSFIAASFIEMQNLMVLYSRKFPDANYNNYCHL